MRALLSIATLLLPVLSAAGVYKWTDPGGVIHYSDRPVSGADRIGIQIDRSIGPVEPKTPVTETGASLGPYNAFEIVTPEQNQTLRDAEGKVAFSLLIEPPLDRNHRLQILVNDQPVEGVARGPQIQLRGFAFGSHRVQARIQDELGETIASSPAIDFHLRRPLPVELRLE